MKKLFLVSILIACVVVSIGSCMPAKTTNWINDFAIIMNRDTRNYLTGLIDGLEQKTSVEMAVVTVGSLEGETIETYANKLFNNWGIGKKRENNGVLFLIAPNERKIRIEVGYGLEPILNDGTCGEIRDKYIIPYFKQNNYSMGIQEGTKAIIRKIYEKYNVTSDIRLKEVAKESEEIQIIKARILPVLFFILFIIPFVIMNFKGDGKKGWGRGFWIGNGGGFGGGGGGGGFGGGSSGGGGASGSW